ncbi:MAG: efflux RND transporter periplasmic adaptor subunit [Isosphaeraceae bacterium]
MPRANAITRIKLAAGAAAMAILAGCERPIEGKAEARDRAPVARVETVRPERQTVRRSVGEPGQLQGFETTDLYANVRGYVKSWSVNIGSQVKKGEVLAEVVVPELDAELRQKRAAVEQAIAKSRQAEASVKVAEANVAGARAKLDEVKAGVSRSEADLARWQAEYRRVEQLFRERAQTGSLVDETRNKLRSAEAARDEVQAQIRSADVGLIQSQAALDQARADVVAAEAAIDVAREDVKRVEETLVYTRIVAPYDGIVIRRNVDTGQLTHPGASGEPLFVVARSDLVTITISIPEAFATALNPGDRAEVKLQAMGGRTIPAEVSRITWALDPKTRTIGAEIDLPNPGGTLLPGLYAYVTVIVEEHADVSTIPTTAVVKEKDKTYCVAVVGGKAMRRPIEIGLNDGTRTEIASGLDEGEEIVKANAASLTDGQALEVIEPAKPPASGAKP